MNNTDNSPRSALARFGCGQHIALSDGTVADIGEVIVSGGPGKGVALLPWALDRYERVMRLRPEESWLLRRLMTLAWEHGKVVYPSFRKMQLQTCATRKTLGKWIDRLEELGYVRCVSEADDNDRRKRYDVSPTYRALAACLLLDPCSHWNWRNAIVEPSRAELAQFDLDFDALARLNRREPDDDDP